MKCLSCQWLLIKIDWWNEYGTSENCILKSYKTYVTDPHEDDKITAEGMMRFLDDLGLNPESRTVLILAWKFGAATQCVFTKEEFLNGLMELG